MAGREQPPGRTDEGPPLEVFLVARLFADQHDPSIGTALAEHGLRRPLPQLTPTAAGRGRAQRVQRASGR